MTGLSGDVLVNQGLQRDKELNAVKRLARLAMKEDKEDSLEG